MLRINSVTHAFDGQPVLHGVDLHIARGDVLCLLGESGSGKTTLLRIVAGLEEGYSGAVTLDDAPVDHLPVHQRDFGLMFQDFALFPHMTVEQNVAFGLKMRGMPAGQRAQRVREMLALVGLEGLARRYVTQLSGGEKQRVALARSLAPGPRLLMLDEPLGSLDAALRERLAGELRAMLKQVGVTALYVTHDQQEAYALADRIAIINAGRIEEIGTPEDIYRRPQTAFTARFLGLHNVLPVLSLQDGLAFTAAGAFPAGEHAAALLLHPDGLHLCEPDSPGALHGRVAERIFRGDHYRYHLSVGDRVDLMFRLASRSTSLPQVGAEVWVRADEEAVIGLA